MNWRMVLIVVGVMVVFLAFKMLGQMGPAAALEHLKQGAKVIDVRSAGEFQSGHLPNAINIPLGDLEQQISQQVTNKKQVLLLHCASGVRSGMGVKTLKRLGYTNVFNLGSYGRAEAIVRESQK
jgi:phage shock protein E